MELRYNFDSSGSRVSFKWGAEQEQKGCPDSAKSDHGTSRTRGHFYVAGGILQPPGEPWRLSATSMALHATAMSSDLFLELTCSFCNCKPHVKSGSRTEPLAAMQRVMVVATSLQELTQEDAGCPWLVVPGSLQCSTVIAAVLLGTHFWVTPLKGKWSSCGRMKFE